MCRKISTCIISVFTLIKIFTLSNLENGWKNLKHLIKPGSTDRDPGIVTLCLQCFGDTVINTSMSSERMQHNLTCIYTCKSRFFPSLFHVYNWILLRIRSVHGEKVFNGQEGELATKERYHLEDRHRSFWVCEGKRVEQRAEGQGIFFHWKSHSVGSNPSGRL